MRKQLPVVTPLKLDDFRNALFYEDADHASFEEAFSNIMGIRYCYLISSCRAASHTALTVLRRFSDREYVIIPAYTCPTVALSIVRAGLNVRLCDISLETFNIDLNSLQNLMDGNILAVVVAHFFGFPCDMRSVRDIASQNGVSIVEDVAQSAGAKLGGERLGTFGDLSCFSLNRGKCFTAYNGGIIATSKQEYSVEIESIIEELAFPNIFQQTLTFHKLLAMHLFSRPGLWWFISKLPLGFEQQYHSVEFRIEKLPEWQANFGRSVLERLDEINSVRRRNGEYLIEHLKEIDDISVPQIVQDAEPVYLRLPIIVESIERRNRLHEELSKHGISASKLYVHSLNRYEYLGEFIPETECPQAEYMSERILSLPTHPLMSRNDLDTILNICGSVC